MFSSKFVCIWDRFVVIWHDLRANWEISVCQGYIHQVIEISLRRATVRASLQANLEYFLVVMLSVTRMSLLNLCNKC